MKKAEDANNIKPGIEEKCIWMISGLITYKLCPRNYKCEECMFDRVMRNESSAMIRRPEVDAALAADLSRIESSSHSRIDSACFYHKNHCWVKVISTDEVITGINSILSRLLYDVKTIVMPKEGENIRRNQFFSHIIQEKHIVPVISPVSGKIISVNQELIDNPALLNTNHHENGWLAVIKPDDLQNDLRTLLFGNKAIEWHKTMERSVSEAIHAAYSVNGSELGPTMLDGGEFILNPSDLLSPEQYYKIIEIISEIS